MFRVILVPTCTAVCFLLGTVATITIRDIRFEHKFKYRGVACGPYAYQNFYKTADGTEVRSAVIKWSNPEIAGLDWIGRIEERNRQGIIKIIERWPTNRLLGNTRSDTFLIVPAEQMNPDFMIIWADEKGLRMVKSKSRVWAEDFAFSH